MISNCSFDNFQAKLFYWQCRDDCEKVKKLSESSKLLNIILDLLLLVAKIDQCFVAKVFDSRGCVVEIVKCDSWERKRLNIILKSQGRESFYKTRALRKIKLASVSSLTCTQVSIQSRKDQRCVSVFVLRLHINL